MISHVTGPMKGDIPYRQPRWVNAIVIAGSILVILREYILPDGPSQNLVLLVVPLLFLFVGVCNKIRAGVFFPRWADRKTMPDQEKSQRHP
jgi:hypothetical protein